MSFFLAFLILSGFSIAFWFTVGVIRFFTELVTSSKPQIRNFRITPASSPRKSLAVCKIIYNNPNLRNRIPPDAAEALFAGMAEASDFFKARGDEADEARFLAGELLKQKVRVETAVAQALDLRGRTQSLDERGAAAGLAFLKEAGWSNPRQIFRHEVAVIVPAHNEQLVIPRMIAALKPVFPLRNVFVGSDASTDQTAAVARSLGLNAVEIHPNRGKAGVLVYLLEYFKILERFKAVVILDADSEIAPDYLEKSLPLFDDPEVAAVAVHARSKWTPHFWPRLSLFFSAYRIRLYRYIQAALRYGQTWNYTNVTSIVPGFASIYRSSVLARMDIAAPGLIIEDFNMTFEIHHKQLGKVAYRPAVYAYSEDPHGFGDYLRQIKRWNLGFWQTIRRHGLWPSRFWFALGFFILEMTVVSLLFLSLPFLGLWFWFHDFEAFSFLGWSIGWLDIMFGIFWADYILTGFVAVIENKPILFVYGLGFWVLRFLDALTFLYTLPLAFFKKSEGKWSSPRRQI